MAANKGTRGMRQNNQQKQKQKQKQKYRYGSDENGGDDGVVAGVGSHGASVEDAGRHVGQRGCVRRCERVIMTVSDGQ